MTRPNRKPGDCGRIPKQDKTGRGVGNRGTPNQPKVKPKK